MLCKSKTNLFYCNAYEVLFKKKLKNINEAIENLLLSINTYYIEHKKKRVKNLQYQT